MPSNFPLESDAIPAIGPVRLPTVDFDLDGQKSSLGELLRLGGAFPLARIQDRLPFTRYMLGAMAEAWHGEPTEWLVCGQAKGQRMITLIHLDRFSEAFESHTEDATALSGSALVEDLPDLEEGSEMLVLCKGLRCLQGATSPA